MKTKIMTPEEAHKALDEAFAAKNKAYAEYARLNIVYAYAKGVAFAAGLTLAKESNKEGIAL